MSTSEDRRRLDEVVHHSAAWRALDRVVVFLSRATASSAAGNLAATSTASVRAWNWSTRRYSIGVVLLTAVAVNVAANLWQQTPPGWQWLILPGMAAAVGLVMLAASAGGDAN